MTQHSDRDIRVRLWTWYRTSPIVDFLWSVYFIIWAVNQHGWQRWLLWTMAVVSSLFFYDGADKNWLRRDR